MLNEIVAQYEKHGWVLRRVLNSDPDTSPPSLPAGVHAVSSGIDALWFSRTSLPGTEAWELRRLTSLPFALVKVIADDVSDSEREDILSDVEENMLNAAVPDRSH
ncbi:MAG: hypothetical protein ACR2IH_06020 [Pyrinomonadaceae bacterium]